MTQKRRITEILNEMEDERERVVAENETIQDVVEGGWTLGNEERVIVWI